MEKLRWVKFTSKTDAVEETTYWYYKVLSASIPDRYENDDNLQTDAEYWAKHLLGVPDEVKCTFERVTVPDEEWLKNEITRTKTGIDYANFYLDILTNI